MADGDGGWGDGGADEDDDEDGAWLGWPRRPRLVDDGVALPRLDCSPPDPVVPPVAPVAVVDAAVDGAAESSPVSS